MVLDILDDGYVQHWGGNVDIDTDSIIAEFLILCTLSITLIIQCIIAFSAMIRMRQNPDIGIVVNICFFSSFVFGFLSCASEIVIHVWDPPNWEHNIGHEMATFISFFSAGLFYWSILLTFIVRLYMTFRQSAYQMSTALMVTFSTILVLYVLLCTPLSILYVFDRSLGHYTLVLSELFIVVCFLYLFGCIFAVYFFISNLSKLAKALITSPRVSVVENEYVIEKRPTDIELNGKQQDLSHLSSKYMLLFSAAMTSTMVVCVLALAIPSQISLRGTLISLDLCVNLWCVYLQFSWAQKHYKRWCGWCDERAKKYGMKRTRRMIHNHSTELQLNVSRELGPLSEQVSNDSEAEQLLT